MADQSTTATIKDSSATFSSIVFLLLAIALAGAIHVVMNARFEADLERQRAKKAALEQEIEAERVDGKRLEVLKDAVEHDPQTVERILRAGEFGREGDVRVDVTEVAPEVKK